LSAEPPGHTGVAGLSNQIILESYSVMESNVFAAIELNRMQIKLKNFSIFDTIRFDLGTNFQQGKPAEP
jgi:hypothetical protein